VLLVFFVVKFPETPNNAPRPQRPNAQSSNPPILSILSILLVPNASNASTPQRLTAQSSNPLILSIP